MILAVDDGGWRLSEPRESFTSSARWHERHLQGLSAQGADVVVKLRIQSAGNVQTKGASGEPRARISVRAYGAGVANSATAIENKPINLRIRCAFSNRCKDANILKWRI
jgi:hypothetical protein